MNDPILAELLALLRRPRELVVFLVELVVFLALVVGLLALTFVVGGALT